MYKLEDIIQDLKHDTPEVSVLEVIECLEQARDTISDLEAKVAELTAKLKQRDFQDEVLEETGRLLDESQATITELKYFAQSIIDHDWHYDSLDDAVRFARAALKESE